MMNPLPLRLFATPFATLITTTVATTVPAPIPMSITRRIAAPFATLIALLTAACASGPPGPAGGVEMQRDGQGAPVVVFQSGLGDGLEVWGAVRAALRSPGAPEATRVAYSRAGYGRSPAAGGERSACRIADEQHAMLAAAGLKPPYVLVGHSLGGLYQAVYAQRYPGEVAGLVLIDPTHPGHWAAMQREVPTLAAAVRLARLGFSETMRREFDAQTACLAALEGQALPPVPVRLLVRGEFRALEAGAFETMVHGLEADWARRLGGAAPQRVAGSGHYIHRERPQVVAEAVAAVLAAAHGR